MDGHQLHSTGKEGVIRPGGAAAERLTLSLFQAKQVSGSAPTTPTPRLLGIAVHYLHFMSSPSVFMKLFLILPGFSPPSVQP